MSSPSFSNIDKWLFELKEGNLSPRQVEELTTFLNAHPELQVDAETWSKTHVSKEEVVYKNIGALERKSTGVYFLLSAVSLLFILFSFYLFNSTKVNTAYNFNDLDLQIEDQKTAEEIIVQFESQEQVAQLVQPSTKIFYVKAEKENKQLVRSIFKFKNDKNKTEEVNSSRGANKNELIEKANLFNPRSEKQVTDKVSASKSISFTDYPSGVPTLKADIASKMHTHQLNNVIASLRQEKEEVLFAESKEDRKINTSKSSTSALKRSLRTSVRKVKNMMDNPIALRNFRDPNFHTPLATDFTFNPAMTGTQVASRLQSTVRINQMGTEREQFNTRVAFDTYLYALRGGLGIDLKHTMNNKGIVQNYEIGFSYSPKFTVKKVISIEPGVRFKVGNKSINTSKLTPGLLMEEERGEVNTFTVEENEPAGSSLWYRDASLGLLVNTPWFYVGGSVDNVGRHYNNIYDNNVTADFQADLYYNAQIGTDYVAQRKDIKLSTYVLYQQRGTFQEAWLGSNLTLSSVYLGVGVSSRIEPAVSVGFDNQRLRLIYQGDYTQSFITLSKGFNHQVTLRYKFKPNRYAMRILKK